MVLDLPVRRTTALPRLLNPGGKKTYGGKGTCNVKLKSTDNWQPAPVVVVSVADEDARMTLFPTNVLRSITLATK